MEINVKIFCIGDIVSVPGREIIKNRLGEIIREYGIDLTIANGENLSHGRGINRSSYEEMTDCGIDGFTMGNHTWDHKDVQPLLMYKNNIIRPANFPKNTPGSGSMLLTAKGGEKVGVINLSGRVYMNACDCPFEAADREIEKLKKVTDIIIVDVHGEATSEKIALGWHLDGRVSAVFGTHTHVQTADETILPQGTAYITDLGMTGAVYSVLGMERKPVIEKFITGMPCKLNPADGKAALSGCIFEIGAEGRATGIERIRVM